MSKEQRKKKIIAMPYLRTEGGCRIGSVMTFTDEIKSSWRIDEEDQMLHHPGEGIEPNPPHRKWLRRIKRHGFA